MMPGKIVFSILAMSVLFSSCSFQSMFYYPDTKDTAIVINDFKYEELFIPTTHGNKLNALFVKPDSVPLGTILVLHGNAGNLAGWKDVAMVLAKHGFQVLIIDYQGFGKSGGSASHQNLYHDALNAFDYMMSREDVKGTKIILLGFSIGAHLAPSIAYERKDQIDALVIEGAFTSHKEIACSSTSGFIRVMASVLVTSQYPAKKYISLLPMPKLIIHSTQDEVIPFAMGQELYKLASEPKEFWQIDGPHIQGIDRNENEYVARIRKTAGIE
jgi:uncharacterized protein